MIATLTTDVPITNANTGHAILTLTLPEGAYILAAKVQVQPDRGLYATAWLTDGTAALDESEAAVASSFPISLVLAAEVDLPVETPITLMVSLDRPSDSAVAAHVLDNSQGAGATWLRATPVGG